jgi:formate hydrogenlyase subunit 3/multisubunit Na+/H+ antiporter MnhD subunit
MVEPIYIIAIALGVAFLLPVFERLGKTTLNVIFLLALTAFVFISGQWLYGFLFQGVQPVQIFTAGLKPPLSINLQMSLQEAVFLTGLNLLALLGGLYLLRHFNTIGVRTQVLFLLLTLGMNGLVMTRDIFNLFVFVEITSIASYALVGMDRDVKSLSAGFKYMLAGSIASTFLLLGIIFLYSYSGTLNIDGMIESPILHSGLPVVVIAIFMLLLSFFIEMKQFPANGWALDVYQAANPGIAAMISAGTSGAMFFALYKILPLAPAHWLMIVAGMGLLTFLVSNWMGLKQTTTTRMLGYSSVGQMGMLLMALAMGFALDPQFKIFKYIILALFFNHFFAKAGLYWLAGLVKQDNIKDWGVLRKKPLLQFLLGVFVLAMLGFPPFAGFWGKWSMVMALAKEQHFWWIGFILLGSLFEAVYLLRWFGYALKGETQEASVKVQGEQHVTLWTFALLSLGVGYLFSTHVMPNAAVLYLPLAAAAVLFVLDGLPAKLKGVLTFILVGGYAYWILPTLSGFRFYFDLLFLLGGLVMLIGTLVRSRRSMGVYPLLLLMLGALSDLVLAKDLVQFFFAWELMTMSSYLLIIRGKKAQWPALTYVVFSLGGAYFLLTGFAFAYAAFPESMSLRVLSAASAYAPWIYLFVAIGFLVKIAALGLHIWAPGAYAEAEDDITPMISGILSKAGIFGFVVLFVQMGTPYLAGISLSAVLGWVGALTALFATLFAVFQEDAKKLLAYSSVGQVGYILLALAAMSHLGWAAALWHTLNHLLFKGLLFLAIAGVIYRTGTRNMYEMGGLIKRMPLSFVSVLIGIIALSGVPPLTGFGGKWLLYEALIEKGWYLQTGIAFFASTIAFLYCYRLIHAIFLGMPKPNQLKIKEAPAWLLIPQYILIAIIMVFSVFPKYLLAPLSRMIDPVFSSTLNWNQYTVYSSLGYWNGAAVMLIVAVIFILLLLYLVLINPKSQKVKPFNIVYAAERPERPETTHYAYKFFTPYQRAMAPVLKPLVKRFWNGVDEWAHALAQVFRQVYTGNGQTYALFILLFGLILYYIMGVH